MDVLMEKDHNPLYGEGISSEISVLDFTKDP